MELTLTKEFSVNNKCDIYIIKIITKHLTSGKYYIDEKIIWQLPIHNSEKLDIDTLAEAKQMFERFKRGLKKEPEIILKEEI